MIEATKLVDYEEVVIERGTVLRCRGLAPYEEIVDFLVCETVDSNSFQLIVSSGYKAGLRYCLFPKESIPDDYVTGLKTQWLIDNWDSWGYIDCPIEEARIFKNIVPKSLDKFK